MSKKTIPLHSVTATTIKWGLKVFRISSNYPNDFCQHLQSAGLYQKLVSRRAYTKTRRRLGRVGLYSRILAGRPVGFDPSGEF